MAGRFLTVATGAGGLATAVAAAGLCVTVGAGHAPGPTLMSLLVAGVVALVIGFVSSFEHQSRLWADQMEAQLQARRHVWQLSTAATAPDAPLGQTPKP